MNQSKKKIGGIFGFLILSFLPIVILYVLSSQKAPIVAAGDGPMSDGYPEPANGISGLGDEDTTGPYPAPNEEQQVYTSETCSEIGSWTYYSDPIVGLSFEYPAEAEIRVITTSDGLSPITIFLHPDCYAELCNGTNTITLSFLKNPQSLTIDEFLEKQFHLSTNPPNNYAQVNFQNRDYVEIGGANSVRVEDGINLSKPEIYIPNGEVVIMIAVQAQSPMPPHPAPCAKTLEMLDGILQSIKLSNLLSLEFKAP